MSLLHVVSLIVFILAARQQGGGEVELSGNSAEAFDDLIKKHGKIAVPNYALVGAARPCIQNCGSIN